MPGGGVSGNAGATTATAGPTAPIGMGFLCPCGDRAHITAVGRSTAGPGRGCGRAETNHPADAVGCCGAEARPVRLGG
jgi:hypothetical protein